MSTRIRMLSRLSWLSRWILSFGWLAVIPFVEGYAQNVFFSHPVLASCSYAVLSSASGIKTAAYTCPALQWDAVVQAFLPRLPLPLIPFLWLLSPRWSVRLAALVAGLLVIGATLLPLRGFGPFIGVGPVTFESDSFGMRAILERRSARAEVVRPGWRTDVLDPGLARFAAWSLALAVWSGLVAAWVVWRILGRAWRQSRRGGILCPQCGHRHAQPHLTCKQCGAPLEPVASQPAG